VHLPAAVLDLEVAVVAECSRPIGAELEDDRMPRPDALRDPVFVDRQAVRDVIGVQVDFDQIVLVDLDPRRIEGETADADRKRLGGRTLILRGRNHGNQAAQENQVPDSPASSIRSAPGDPEVIEGWRHLQLIVRRTRGAAGRCRFCNPPVMRVGSIALAEL
jgi:hypothetical protein